MQNRLGVRMIFRLPIIFLAFTLIVSPVSAKYSTTSYINNPLEGLSDSGKIWFVHDTASGANNGTSWGDALTDLQKALDVASAGDEIWIAGGSYWPSKLSNPDDPRTATFQLTNDVALYGGFSGTETIRDDRNWHTNITILSGDIDHNDMSTNQCQILGPNAYHVITTSGVNTTAILDGLTITRGYANDNPPNNDKGGGIFNEGGSPTLNNLIFTCNFANNGAGLYNNQNSSPNLSNRVIC